jgi:hypothetical protein
MGALGAGGALTAVAASAPARAAASVGAMPNIPQTWNNCGPAAIAEVLAYWGIERTQAAVAAVLRVDGANHGMSPYGVPSYARSLGMRALVGVVGSTALLKALIGDGFPVIVTQWESMANDTSHYRPLTAYDDRRGVFLADDPLFGSNHAIGYADFAAMWAPDDSRFLVLYPPARGAALNDVLAAAGWNAARAYRADLAWVRARLFSQDPLVPSWAYPVAVPGARFLRLAWDNALLGQTAAARAALRQAASQGAAPAAAGWIAATMV